MLSKVVPEYGWVGLGGVAGLDLMELLLGEPRHEVEPVGGAVLDCGHCLAGCVVETPDDAFWISVGLRVVRPLVEVRVAFEDGVPGFVMGDHVRAGGGHRMRTGVGSRDVAGHRNRRWRRQLREEVGIGMP
jgi:hypothetical protein